MGKTYREIGSAAIQVYKNARTLGLSNNRGQHHARTYYKNKMLQQHPNLYTGYKLARGLVRTGVAYAGMRAVKRAYNQWWGNPPPKKVRLAPREAKSIPHARLANNEAVAFRKDQRRGQRTVRRRQRRAARAARTARIRLGEKKMRSRQKAVNSQMPRRRRTRKGRKRRMSYGHKKRKRKRKSLTRQLEDYTSTAMSKRNFVPESRVVAGMFPKERKVRLVSIDTVAIQATFNEDLTDYNLYNLEPNDLNSPNPNVAIQGDGYDELRHIYQSGVCYKYKIQFRLRNNGTPLVDDILCFMYATGDTTKIYNNSDQLKKMRVPFVRLDRSTDEVPQQATRWVSMTINPRLCSDAQVGVPEHLPLVGNKLTQVLGVHNTNAPDASSYVKFVFFKDQQDGNNVKLAQDAPTAATTNFLMDLRITQSAILYKRKALFDIVE